MKENITDLLFKELKDILIKRDVNPRIAYQIFNWIYRKFQFNFLEMSDISKKLRNFLDDNFQILSLKYVKHLISEDEEAIKFLFETNDKNLIETVLIISPKSDDESRLTLCVSSQIGCPLKCEFCATGQAGFKRNLFPSEIISQVLMVERFIMDSEKLNFFNHGKEGSLRNIGNIVFMGMGEPFLNIESVLKSVEILTFSGGYNIGSRHITLSTAGILDSFDFIKNVDSQIRLAVSLHSPFQEVRERLMPVAKTNDLSHLIEELASYQKETKRRITFEYVLLDGINDREADAKELKELLKNLDYNLNLIPYNPVENENLRPSSEKAFRDFILSLEKYGIPYVVRKSKGGKIKAGCGQLSYAKRESHI
ncbi:MAG: 23S rRNA (adenine(2503)-C(2))-methyltransferase RlmN [Brevinematia bacterium]